MRIASLVLGLGVSIFGLLGFGREKPVAAESNWKPHYSLEEKYDRIDEKVQYKYIDEEEAEVLKERVSERYENCLENGPHYDGAHMSQGMHAQRGHQGRNGQYNQNSRCGSHRNR